jgi:hypothetical protein
MFNRGRQYVSDTELNQDFVALRVAQDDGVRPSATMDSPITEAMRTIGKFFFVHAAEADGHLAGLSRQTYEFLHATFGEYLIAATTVNLLIKAGRQRSANWDAPYRTEVQEPLLATLLSLQPFVQRCCSRSRVRKGHTSPRSWRIYANGVTTPISEHTIRLMPGR